jgi:lipopolysaccharide/colanic/teichoic acid biosynthesis glycosyltransferase
MSDAPVHSHRFGYATVGKRWLDVIIAALLLVVLAPVWLLTALLLLIAQRRPILYRQPRAGLGGRAFAMLKFRTMTPGEPPRLPGQPVAKDPADPRVTPLGRVLRRLSIDELPQLVNVLRGEMSLVGPRPLPMDDLAHPEWLAGVDMHERQRRLDWLARRHQVLPGLTGLWQISPQNEADFDNWIANDLAYVDERSLSLDVAILLKTPWAVLRGRRRR